METRRSSRVKHKLDDEKETPKIKKVKSETDTESPKKKTQSPKKATKSPKKTTKASKKETESSEKETESPNKETESPKKENGKDGKKILHESSTLETGHIYFFYRPKVEHKDAHKLDDVQKLYMVLKPERETGTASLGKNRLVVMTAKRLPDSKTHSRFWAFVETASDDISDITKKLEPAKYETKTLGERHLAGCRPCGCGMYSIVHHLEGKYKSSTHTHIAYVMEVPEKLGEVQKAFQIHQEGSFIVTVKNPKSTQGRGLGPSQRADYPDSLQSRFGKKKFTPAEPTALLDYDGAELILIGAKDDIVEDLGKPAENLEEAAEEEEKEEEKKHHDHRCSLAEEQVFHNMHMRHKEHPAEPLLEGTWE